jgi:hypothetical protein
VFLWIEETWKTKKLTAISVSELVKTVASLNPSIYPKEKDIYKLFMIKIVPKLPLNIL